ncbi:MAG: hypothetical protein A4E30_00656 [Methanomassiliicoccales archaeon PtaB.Bin215]|nr:MAG: hypothetical protein A4E30_00656 [Methanomassiliicoccales archaeon PtaB.Bin215]
MSRSSSSSLSLKFERMRAAVSAPIPRPAKAIMAFRPLLCTSEAFLKSRLTSFSSSSLRSFFLIRRMVSRL